MSKQEAGKRLALFNRMDGRGDVLSIPVEKGAELASLPKGMFAEILYPLFQWWVYGTETEPTDPRDRMVFNGLKTHQIENAVKRGANLASWNANSVRGGRPSKDKKPSGNQVETKRVQLEVLDEVQVEDARASLQSCSSSLAGGGQRVGLTPPVAPPLSVEDAKKTLAMYAPQIMSHAKMKTSKGAVSPWSMRYSQAPSDAATLMVAAKLYPRDVDEKDDAVADIIEGNGNYDLRTDLPKAFFSTMGGKFAEAVFAVCQEIFDVYEQRDENGAIDKTDDVFRRALLDAAIAAKENNADNPTAWVLARLKKVLAAVRTLESDKPPSKATK